MSRHEQSPSRLPEVVPSGFREQHPEEERIVRQECFLRPREFQGAKSSSCTQRLRDLRLRWERGRESCKQLTLSGMQENFSEIIKGTPSIAAREERRGRP